MKFIKMIILLLILAGTCKAQNDQIVNARSNYVQITNPSGPTGTVKWSTLASQTYVFTPISPDYSLCVSMVNNNPTNAHPFSFAAFATGDSNVSDYSHNTGRYSSITPIGVPTSIAASSTIYFYVPSKSAALVALQFTGAGTLAGNPDTVDIFAVQTTTTSCGATNPQTGQQYTLSTPNTGTSSAPPIMAISDGTSTSYATTNTSTNPASNSIINLIENVSSNAKNLYFDKIILSSSVAVNIQIETINTTAGFSGCTGPNSGFNLKINTPGSSGANVYQSCTAGGSILSTIGSFQIGAGNSLTVDLKGIISNNSSTTGIEVLVVTGVTGLVSSSIYWYEK